MVFGPSLQSIKDDGEASTVPAMTVVDGIQFVVSSRSAVTRKEGSFGIAVPLDGHWREGHRRTTDEISGRGGWIHVSPSN